MSKMSPKLPNDLRIRIFGNEKISRKALKCLELKAGAKPPTIGTNLDSCSRNYKKSALKKFHSSICLQYFARDGRAKDFNPF